jgi:hypothetical protein
VKVYGSSHSGGSGLMYELYLEISRDSVVGIATGYGLDDRGG